MLFAMNFAILLGIARENKNFFWQLLVLEIILEKIEVLVRRLYRSSQVSNTTQITIPPRKTIGGVQDHTGPRKILPPLGKIGSS